MPTNAECTVNRDKIYLEINANRSTLSEIKGGVRVLVWLLPLVFAMICTILAAMINQRFDAIEKQLQHISEQRTDTEPHTAATAETPRTIARNP